MKYIFRCDSSYEIGSGHLIRCLNLAKKLEGEIHFICRELKGNINALVEKNQFILHKLPRYSESKITQDDELVDVKNILRSISPSVIFVDHYQLDLNWERQILPFSTKLIAIDDIERVHESTAIIDQNFRQKIPEAYKQNSQRLFLGPTYSLIGDSFLKLPSFSRCFDSVQTVMVFFGGSDFHSQTLRLVRLALKNFSRLNWNFVLGSQNRDFYEIQRLLVGTEHFVLHRDISYMPELMIRSDLFIGAGGSTSWERAYVNLPSLVISVAENQEKLSESLSQAGVISYIGHFDKIDDKDLVRETKCLIDSKDRRVKLGKNSRKLKVASKFYDLIHFLN